MTPHHDKRTGRHAVADHNPIVDGGVCAVTLEGAKHLVNASNHIKAAFAQWNASPETPSKGFLFGIVGLLIGIVFSTIIVRNTVKEAELLFAEKNMFPPICEPQTTGVSDSFFDSVGSFTRSSVGTDPQSDVWRFVA